MIRVKIEGTEEYANFPDGTSKEDMWKLLQTHPTVIAMRQTQKPTQEAQKQAPSENDKMKEIFKNAVTPSSEPYENVSNVLGGVATTGSNINAIMSHLLGKAFPQGNKIQESLSGIKPESFGQPGFAQEAGKYLPFGELAGASLPLQIVAGAGSQAVEPNATPEKILLGGGANAALGIGGKALGYALNKFMPSQYLLRQRGLANPQEIAENANIAQGTETPLYSVIDSPNMQRHTENVIARNPQANEGYQQSLQRTKETLTNQGHELLGNSLGVGSPVEYEADLRNALVDANKNATKLKNDLYKETNQHAEETGFIPELVNFKDKLRDHVDTVLDANVFAMDKSLGNKIKDLIRGVNQRPLTLQEANTSARYLKDEAQNYLSSSTAAERSKGKILMDLAKTLKSDVKNDVANSGDKVLIDKFGKAEKNYSENYSEFLEDELRKYTSPGSKADSDLIIQNFIKTGKSADRANLVKKLVNVLPDDKKNLLAYGYFQRAIDQDGELAPQKLATLIKGLGRKQYQALIPDETLRQQLSDYAALSHMNKKAFEQMFNPNTGQTLLDQLANYLPAAIGGTLKGVAGSVASVVGKSWRDREIARLMTNPEFRQRYLANLTNPEQNNLLPNLVKALQGSSNIGGRKLLENKQNGY